MMAYNTRRPFERLAWKRREQTDVALRHLSTALVLVLCCCASAERFSLAPPRSAPEPEVREPKWCARAARALGDVADPQLKQVLLEKMRNRGCR